VQVVLGPPRCGPLDDGASTVLVILEVGPLTAGCCVAGVAMAFGFRVAPNPPRIGGACGVAARPWSRRDRVGLRRLQQSPHTSSESRAGDAADGGRCVLPALRVAVLGVDVEGTGDEHLDGAVWVVQVEVLDPGRQPRAHNPGRGGGTSRQPVADEAGGLLQLPVIEGRVEGGGPPLC
jgi:hypothetical protein